MHPTTPESIGALLYEGALSAEHWSAGLDALRVVTQSEMFHHVAWDWQAQCVVAGLFNAQPPAEKVREYEQHLAPSDPRVPMVMTMPMGQVLYDHEHFTPRDMSRSPIYADWLASNRLRHSLGVPVFDGGGVREWVCLIRPLDHAHYGAETQALLRRLMPDLLRAAGLRARLAHTAGRAALGMAALETLPGQAVAVLDARGQARYLNPVALRTLQDPTHGLTACQGALAAREPAVQDALRARVVAACAARPRAGTLRVPRPGGALTVHVLPLRATHPLAAGRDESMALLAWTLPAAAPQAERLAALLGLSPAEARLALALSQGQSIKDFAQAQGCSWHTARTHMGNLLRKTGLRRQAEVAQLAQTLLPA